MQVEGVREELPTVARFLEQHRLPAELATSLSRIRGLIEASPPAPPLKRGDAAPQPQPQVIAVIPPLAVMPPREQEAPHGTVDAEAPGIVRGDADDDDAVPPKERSDEQQQQDEEEEEEEEQK